MGNIKSYAGSKRCGTERIASIFFEMVAKVFRWCKKNANDALSEKKIGLFVIQKGFVKSNMLILNSCFVS